MSELKDPRKIKVVKLPSFPEDEVEMYSSLTLGDVSLINQGKDDIEKGIKTLICLIKSWTFTDANGGKLPINSENLGKLPIKDTTLLMKQIEIETPKKK